MPRYFFNIRNLGTVADKFGEELPNDKAAWREATAIAGEIFKDISGEFRPGRELKLEVTDENQEPLYIIHITGQKLKLRAI